MIKRHKFSIKIALVVLALLFFISSCGIKQIDITSEQRINESITAIRNVINDGRIAEDNQHIYYTQIAWNEGLKRNDYYLYRANLDGTESVLVSRNDCYKINATEDKLFYIDGNDNAIYRMNKDGSNVERLWDSFGFSLIAYNDKLYFIGKHEGIKGIYSMNYDGSEVKKLCEGDILPMFYPYKGYIYYILRDKDLLPYRVDLDGIKPEKLSDQEMVSIFIIDDTVYFHSYSNWSKLHKMDLSDRKVNKLENSMENVYEGSMCVYNNYLFYACFAEKTGIHRYDLSTGEDVRISKRLATYDDTPIYAAAGRLFYIGLDGKTHCMDFNGKNHRVFQQ